ncbi:MAG: GHKL domain-containing protein [Oscillospiraceae bacterium]|nr:GHKL domain-containing protein [Oscillospiraceae bacterium]
MVLSNYISISLSSFCIVILLLVYACVLIEHDKGTKMIRLFMSYIMCSLGLVVFDIVAYLTGGNPEPYAYYLVRISNFLHYAFGPLALTAFTFYMFAYLEVKTKVPQSLKAAMLSMCAFSLVLTVISQFTGIYYTIDENNIYHRGEIFWLSQLLPLAGLIMNMGIVVYYRKIFERKFLIFSLAYMVLPVMALCMAMLYYGVTFINIATTLSVLVLYIGVQIEHSQSKTIRIKEMDNQLELQREYYLMLQTHIDETKKARHDLRHHLSVFQSFADTGETEKLAGYINEYEASLPDDTGLAFCENYAVSSILRYYVDIAKREGISVEVHTELPEKTSVGDTDLCIVFGNCIENAIEAARKVTGKKFIKVNSMIIGDMLAIVIDNSFAGDIIKKGDTFASSKRGGGIGVSSVKAVARRYNGETKFEAKDNVFQASVMLPVGTGR